MKATVAALLALCFLLLGVNDAAAGGNKKGKVVPTALVPVPIDGECGSNAASYAADTTAFTGTFCKVGEPSSASVLFPNQGSTALWVCEGLRGGKTAACVALRQQAEKPALVLAKPTPIKKCGWRQRYHSQFVSGQSAALSSMLVPVCNCCGNGYVSVGGSFFSTPSQTIESVSLQWVCE